MNKKIKKYIVYVVIAVSLISFNVFYSFTTVEYPIYDNSINASNYGNVGEIAGSTISQSFFCNRDGMFSVMINFANYERENNSLLEYSIANEKGEILKEGQFEASNFKNNEFVAIEFDKANNSKGKKYIVRINDIETELGNAVTIFTGPSNSKTLLTIANNENTTQIEKESIIMKFVTKSFDIETLVILIFFECFIYAFIKVLYKFLR